MLKLAALTALLTFVTLGALAPGRAHAFSSVPGHADIKVKAGPKKGAAVRSCTVSFCVRSPTNGYARAFPALMEPAKAMALKSGNRAFTINPDHGHIRVEGHPIEVPTLNTVVNASMEIDYDAHGLNSGDRLYLVTAWPSQAASGDRRDAKHQSPHVFGTITQTDTANEFVLP